MHEIILLDQYWTQYAVVIFYLKYMWCNNFQEIDYTKEAANAEKFADNFKNMDYVKVPTINWEYTTPQV